MTWNKPTLADIVRANEKGAPAPADPKRYINNGKTRRQSRSDRKGSGPALPRGRDEGIDQKDGSIKGAMLWQDRKN